MIITTYTDANQPILYVSPEGNGDHQGADWENTMTLQESLDVTEYYQRYKVFMLHGDYSLKEGHLQNFTYYFGGFEGREDELPENRQLKPQNNMFEFEFETRLIPYGNIYYKKVFLDQYQSKFVYEEIDKAEYDLLNENPAYKDLLRIDQAINGQILNLYNASEIYFDGITFCNANSNVSGQVYVRGNATFNCCYFHDNMSAQFGGALYMQTYKMMSSGVMNSCFFNNRANGGGALCADYAQVIQNCLFYNNESGNKNMAAQGGAIFLRGDAVNINSCTFVNNKSYYFGQAIDTSKTNCIIINSIFWNNQFDRSVAWLSYIKNNKTSSLDYFNRLSNHENRKNTQIWIDDDLQSDNTIHDICHYCAIENLDGNNNDIVPVSEDDLFVTTNINLKSDNNQDENLNNYSGYVRFIKFNSLEGEYNKPYVGYQFDNYIRYDIMNNIDLHISPYSACIGKGCVKYSGFIRNSYTLDQRRLIEPIYESSKEQLINPEKPNEYLSNCNIGPYLSKIPEIQYILYTHNKINNQETDTYNIMISYTKVNNEATVTNILVSEKNI